MITDYSQQKVENLRNTFPYPDNLVVKKADFSMKELEKASEIIRTNADSLDFNTIVSWGVNLKKNKLEVTLTESNTETRKAFEELVDSKYLIFEQSSRVDPSGEYITELQQYHRPLYGGITFTSQ
jgi:hypothetical protein